MESAGRGRRRHVAHPVAHAPAIRGTVYNVILVARREDRLVAVQQEITTQYGVQVEVIAIDLKPADVP